MSDASIAVPPHIPPELVYDFDFFNVPAECPHRTLARQLHGGAPDIFFSPRNGGHWVITRYADAMEIMRRPEMFSSDPAYNAARQMTPRFAPLQYDPPEATEMRGILAQSFSPAAISRQEKAIRQLAAELIEGVYEKGTCDFTTEIAQLFSVTIFLQMAPAPLSDRPWLATITERYLRGATWEERAAGRASLSDYLSGLIVQKSQENTDDLISTICRRDLASRPMTDSEKLGMVALMFFAGLDTVVATVAFMMHFLATNPGHYARLVDDPAFIDNALEELIRVHAVTFPERGVARDFEFSGVHFKTGDRIVLLNAVLGLDDREMPDADKVDFDRPVSKHLAFGTGAHRCLGSHLARLELRVLLEEWVRRIPQFTAGKVVWAGGTVWIPKNLELFWDVKR